MTIVFNDAYTDVPRTQRDALAERIRQLKCGYWSDPGDTELLDRIAAMEAALRVLDRNGDAS